MHFLPASFSAFLSQLEFFAFLASFCFVHFKPASVLCISNQLVFVILLAGQKSTGTEKYKIQIKVLE
jgi:hypothetical protein